MVSASRFAVASLPERRRTDLTLLVGGLSYAEIAEITGGCTITSVNKNLAEVRARIRLQPLARQPTATHA